MLSQKEILRFRKTIWNYYKKHRRKLPWRDAKDPYRVLVSEVMLQQTQVSRVLTYYPLFIKRFPNVRALARAPLSAVLSVWSGLGYNRRAKFLHEAAKIIVQKYGGKIPNDTEALVALPGVGEATAGAIATFAFNKPAVFIETNTRTVYIHYFFKHFRCFGCAQSATQHSHILENMRMLCGENTRISAQEKIHDREIFPLIEQTLDKTYSREWFYALMDYGAMLKEKYGNSNQKSAHYAKQSPFQNSNRQVRGEILKLLIARKSIPRKKIKQHVRGDVARIKNALTALQKENLIVMRGNTARLSP